MSDVTSEKQDTLVVLHIITCWLHITMEYEPLSVNVLC